MDNTSEDILCILKEEVLLVHISSTPACCGKTEQKRGRGYTFNERSIIICVWYAFYICMDLTTFRVL